MILFFGLVVIVSLLGIKRSDNTGDYMSINRTNAVKGIFLCMVFFSHIQGYTNFSNTYLDEPYLLVRKITGQCIVTMFLFYSGYGIMESIKKKGNDYINQIPRRRFLRVILLFDSAIMLFWLYRYFMGTHYSIKKMLLVLIGWDGIGNSNWYIFCVLWLYIFTYIAFKVFHQYTKAVAGVAVLSVLYMAFLSISQHGSEYWWYDTILCYTYGMLFSLYRKPIEQNINEDTRTWTFYLALFMLGFFAAYLHKNENIIIYEIYIFCFVAMTVVFTMRYVIDSKLLQWIGENLFELYILQRIPMMALIQIFPGNMEGYRYLYVAACIICTFIIAIIFRETLGRFIKKYC